ncbi:hypothetical protein [Streptomyces griseoluteus]|uniref:hypothetical protein n=1 Tax=Streptomyces griseoluteus TaxID=29306 RepID=UPI0036FD2F3A
MPPEPEQSFSSSTDAEETAILDPVPGAPAPGGYGDRLADDAFDYPSSTSHSWSADQAPTAADELGVEPHPPAGRHGSRAGAVRGREGWRQAVVRPRSALMAVAALLVLGGFGLALSAVSDTVTSPATPGGTAQVTAPKSPTTQPLTPVPPSATEPSGGVVSPAAIPTPAGVPPVTGEDRDRGEEHEREDQQREDGDDADG